MTDATRRQFIERALQGLAALPFLLGSGARTPAHFIGSRWRLSDRSDCLRFDSSPEPLGHGRTDGSSNDLSARKRVSAKVQTRGHKIDDSSLSDADCTPTAPPRNQPPLPTFSIMLWGFFRGRSTREKLRLLHQAGFRAFEFTDWHREDLEALALTIRELGLTLNCINGNGGVAGPSNKSPLDPRQRREFIAEVTASLAALRKLGGQALIILTGNALAHLSRHRQRQSCIAALKEVAPLAHEANVTLLLEPLNIRVDHPGYFLVHSDEAFEIIDQVNSPSVKILFDVYHQQISEGNLIATITKNIARIGHFHIADVPGRHEPGTGEINYANVLQAIVRSGYRGFIGLEFIPSRDDFFVLEQVKELGRKAGIR